MTTTLAPPRYDAPIGRTPDGSPVIGDRAFMDYISRALFERVGGALALTNADLHGGTTEALTIAQAAVSAPDWRGAVQALAQRVADLEAQLAARRPQQPGASAQRVEELAAITLGGRSWR